MTTALGSPFFQFYPRSTHQWLSSITLNMRSLSILSKINRVSLRIKGSGPWPGFQFYPRSTKESPPLNPDKASSFQFYPRSTCVRKRRTDSLALYLSILSKINTLSPPVLSPLHKLSILSKINKEEFNAEVEVDVETFNSIQDQRNRGN